ncbi:YVH1 [Sanghuangporus sanghuang]
MADQDDNPSIMDEVVKGLWVGSIHAAADAELLRQRNIHSVLSCMRGKVKIAETFTHFQIQLDDTEDADALAFFPQCISFIENELEQGRGVLVHCQAGMSRSATIVAAYLMYAEQLDAELALEKIKKARPSTQPNDGFLAQLDVFYQASYKVSRKNKIMRMYYLERALDEIMNGDGTLPSTNMFASFPRTPGDSAPPTPGAHVPRRRIRCKFCRTELAAREHMLDHGQVGPATPAAASVLSPAASRRPSSSHMLDRPFSLGMTPMTQSQAQVAASSPSRRGSAGVATAERMVPLATLNGEPVPMSRRPSGTNHARPFDLAALAPRSGGVSRSGSFGAAGATRPRRSSNLAPRRILEGIAMDDTSAIADDDDEEDEDEGEVKVGVENAVNAKPETANSKPEIAEMTAPTLRKPSGYMSPAELAAQLQSNPKLAALRSPGVSASSGLQPMTPLTPPASAPVSSKNASQIAPPLLVNPNCSGYFVEPMRWMEPFLESGDLGGKIICPNKKCGAKLGNYDWAGVCCSCKEWVTPGFCIHKSKVDEIVI